MNEKFVLDLRFLSRNESNSNKANLNLPDCYLSYNSRYITSYHDVKVCDEWHNFQTFCDDIKLLDGYENWLNNKGLYHLDKDIKIKGNRVYNKEACIFVYYSENLSEGSSKANIKDISYYEIFAMERCSFKKVCLSKNLKLEYFDEKFSNIYISPNGRRRTKYFYTLKEEWR